LVQVPDFIAMMGLSQRAAVTAMRKDWSWPVTL